MTLVVALSVLDTCIKKRGLSRENAWILVTANSVMQVTEVPCGKLRDAPLEDRIGGLCSYVRASELFDLIRWKFGEDISHITVKPLVRRSPDGTISTDILIESEHVSLPATARMFREQEAFA